jgi:hypothetical protein
MRPWAPLKKCIRLITLSYSIPLDGSVRERTNPSTISRSSGGAPRILEAPSSICLLASSAALSAAFPQTNVPLLAWVPTSQSLIEASPFIWTLTLSLGTPSASATMSCIEVSRPSPISVPPTDTITPPKSSTFTMAPHPSDL